MALKVEMKLYEGKELDRYHGQDGQWHFEVYVPHGEYPITADVHFEFEDEEKTEP